MCPLRPAPARLDILLEVSVVCTCVAEQMKSEWNSLAGMIKFLHVTQDKVLHIAISGDLSIFKWMDAAPFLVYFNLKSHNGATIHLYGDKKVPPK